MSSNELDWSGILKVKNHFLISMRRLCATLLIYTKALKECLMRYKISAFFEENK